MRPWQPLQPDEVTDPEAGYDDHVDRADALAMGRELESASVLDPVQPSPEFVDSVMAAIEREPSPRPASAIVAPLRNDGIGGLLASVRSAFAMVSLGAGRPLAARAAALGYLVVVGALGLALGGGAVIGAAGALGLLDDADRPQPTPVVAPTSSPEPSASGSPLVSSPSPSPSGSPEPSGSAEPSGSPDPSASAAPSRTPGPSPTRTPTPSPSDSPDPSESPEESDTPEPSKTPKPSDTPEPSGTP